MVDATAVVSRTPLSVRTQQCRSYILTFANRKIAGYVGATTFDLEVDYSNNKYWSTYSNNTYW